MTKISDAYVYYDIEWAGALKKAQIPSHFNLNQYRKINAIGGRMEHTQVCPQAGNFIDLRAEMDLLGAPPSACPDLAVGGKSLDVSIHNSST